MRERVYPRWVANGKMTQALCDREIWLMSAIVGDYEARASGERLI